MPEILLGLTFLLWVIQSARQRKFSRPKKPQWGLGLLILFLINAGLVTYFSGDLVLYGYFLIRAAEAGMIYWLIRQEIVPHSSTIKWLLYGAVFQVMLAYFQTRINSSLGLHFIGEPSIGPEVMNVAKTDLISGAKHIRPYGTFLHPNILGAYLMSVLFIALPYLKKNAIPFWLIFLTAGIYLTGSQAAQLATLTAFGILFLFGILKKASQKRLLSLGMFVVLVMLNAWLFVNSSALRFSTPSIHERLEQNIMSLNMFLNKFWGVGIGNFTLSMENFSVGKLLPWEFQPVHNSYFLALNETGLQGFTLLLLLIAYILHNYWKDEHDYSLQDKARILALFSLLFIASLDHLLWTSYIGAILVGFVLAETTRTTHV